MNFDPMTGQPLSQQLAGIAGNISGMLPQQVGATVPAMSAATAAQVARTGPGGATVPQGIWGRIGGVEGLGSIASALGSIGQVWGAIQGVKLAKDQLAFSKDAYRTNLGNQTQSYNTALEDRTRARHAFEGRSTAETLDYISKHSL